jgi:transposase InsO family protein
MFQYLCIAWYTQALTQRHMAYTTNPNVPKVRWEAVKMLRSGRSSREVARHFGYAQSTVVRWARKAGRRNAGPIPTESSRPKRSPRALPEATVRKIVEKRLERNRCGQVVHQELLRAGVDVSLSSVQRTLGRCRLLKKRSPWKRPHDFTPRPEAAFPGALVEVDTVHIRTPSGRTLYVYTLVDVHSRFAYAKVTERIGAKESARFLKEAVRKAPFPFVLAQTDNGSEFSTGFTYALRRMGVSHRHARVRRSNDQAHVERFNRTLQEECLDHVFREPKAFRKALREYLPYYNGERLHMGIGFRTPAQVMQSY